MKSHWVSMFLDFHIPFPSGYDKQFAFWKPWPIETDDFSWLDHGDSTTQMNYYLVAAKPKC